MPERKIQIINIALEADTPNLLSTIVFGPAVKTILAEFLLSQYSTKIYINIKDINKNTGKAVYIIRLLPFGLSPEAICPYSNLLPPAAALSDHFNCHSYFSMQQI